MGDTDLTTRSLGSDLLRSILSAFDRPAYWLLGLVYELFFNVASAEFLSSDTMVRFYARVQVILGVFMVFELAIVFLKAIAQPDSFSKDKGFGSLLTRVATSLLILTSLMPISIASPRNAYERRISESGLLFGTLYSLQDRILDNNTIGRLIMGTASSDSDYYNKRNGTTTNKRLKQAANNFTTTVLRGFYRINLIPESERTSNGSGDPAAIKSNRVCTDSTSDKIIQGYNSSSVSPGDIISLVNETCDINDSVGSWISNTASNIGNFLFGGAKIFSGNKKYVFTYMPVISTIVGIVFVFIFLSFTIDVAVRSIKLAVLRLLAPIPVLAHIDPNGSKDSAFNSWVKTLTSTYLDLFIRLAVVYFVIFIIQDMISHKFSINTGASGAVNVFTMIVIWIGLFVFAKQAPKFIKDMIGIKNDSVFKMFGGLGEALGVGAVAAGTAGSFRSSMTASRLADETNGRNANSLLNRGKHLMAGIGGAVVGGATGYKAFAGAKDHQGKAVMDAVQQRNMRVISDGASGATLLGRFGARGARIALGDTGYDKDVRRIAGHKDIASSGEDLFGYLEKKGKSSGAALSLDGFSGDYTNAHGTSQRLTLRAGDTLDSYNTAKRNAQQAFEHGGAGVAGTAAAAQFTFGGVTFDIRQNLDDLEGDIAAAAGTAWARTHSDDAGLVQKVQTYNENAQYLTDRDGNATPERFDTTNLGNAKKVKKAAAKAKGQVTFWENDPRFKRRKANYGAAGAGTNSKKS